MNRKVAKTYNPDKNLVILFGFSKKTRLRKRFYYEINEVF